MTARPTIGVGNGIGGMAQLAQRRAGVQLLHLGHGHDLAGPGLVDRLRLVGLHVEQLAPILTPLRTPTTGTCRSFLQRAARRRG